MRKYLLGLVLLSSISVAEAQNYYASSQEEFGQNRVQTKRFEWLTLKSNNFEFNYYRGGEKIAKEAAKIAESEYYHITELLGYTPFSSMKIFIYNSPKDLQQSNIGLTSSVELDGSILNMARSRIQIPYMGNDANFKKDLVFQITKLFIYDMLYGGSLKEVLQSSLLLTVPDWYMSGIARYISENAKDPIVLEKMRTTILKNQNKKLSHLKGEDAQIIGQSIWNYIANRYGKDNISNILNLTRIIRDEESSVASTLGLSYSRFIREWRDFYVNGAYQKQPESAKIDSTTQKTAQNLSKKTSLLDLKEGEVDTDNYEFDEKNIANLKITQTETDKKTGLVQDKYKRHREELKLQGPKAYKNMVIMNGVKTEFWNDPVRRIGMNNTLMLNDLLENHVMKAGIFITPVLRNHDIFLEYKNYEKRLDWGLRYDRRSLAFDDVDDSYGYLFRPLKVTLPSNSSTLIYRRNFYNRFMATASYPFSNELRASISPFLTVTNDIDLGDLRRDNLQTFYGGYRAELVFDNTKKVINNIQYGTKAKLRFDRYYGINSGNVGFNKLILDARHYQKIIDGVVLAGRLSYGRSLGNSPKYFYVGGTENWLNRSVMPTNGTNGGVPTDLRDMLFYDFTGNLRGFDFGKMYGTSHVLMNLELRFSMAKYFPQGAVSSSFLRSLQVVLFDDIGTAWNGKNGPLSRQNSLNTEVIGGGSNPFRATVTNFKNPFLMGYGVGLRTTILGYFVRADYAWGLEDKVVNTPKIHLSLGYDF